MESVYLYTSPCPHLCATLNKKRSSACTNALKRTQRIAIPNSPVLGLKCASVTYFKHMRTRKISHWIRTCSNVRTAVAFGEWLAKTFLALVVTPAQQNWDYAFTRFAQQVVSSCLERYLDDFEITYAHARSNSGLIKRNKAHTHLIPHNPKRCVAISLQHCFRMSRYHLCRNVEFAETATHTRTMHVRQSQRTRSGCFRKTEDSRTRLPRVFSFSGTSLHPMRSQRLLNALF